MKSSVLGFAAALALPFALAGASFAEEPSPADGNHAPEIAHQSWSFTAPFGTFDNAQLQRGFQVYRVWMSSIPFARLTHCRPAALKTFASAAPPERPRRALKPARSSASTASRTARSSSRKR